MCIFIHSGNKDKRHERRTSVYTYCAQGASGFISLGALLYWNNKSIAILALDTHYNTLVSCGNAQYEFKSPEHGIEGGHVDLENQLVS